MYNQMRIKFMFIMKILAFFVVQQAELQNAFLPHAFAPIQPIHYDETEFIVEDHTSANILIFVHHNPCNIIPDSETHESARKNILGIELRANRLLKKRCEEVYDREILPAIIELAKTKPLYQGKMNEFNEANMARMPTDYFPKIPNYRGQANGTSLNRHKRNQPGAITAAVGTGLTASLVAALPGVGAFIVAGVLTVIISNYVNSFMERMDPNSPQNQFARMEASLQNMTNIYNQNILTHSQLRQNFTDIHNKLNENHENILKHLGEFEEATPSIAWLAATIYTKLYERKQVLRNIQDHYKFHQQLAIGDLQRISNITDRKNPELNDVHQTDTQLLKININDKNDLFFYFFVKHASRTTSINRIISFPLLERKPNSTESILKRYIGPEYFLHNKTNDCMKAIDIPKHPQKYFQIKCKKTNSTDDSLGVWEYIPENSANFKLYVEQPKIHRIRGAYIIWCYNNNITIDGYVNPCPAYTFRLPLAHQWELGDQEHRFYDEDNIEWEAMVKPHDHLDLSKKHNFTNDFVENGLRSTNEIRHKLRGVGDAPKLIKFPAYEPKGTQDLDLLEKLGISTPMLFIIGIGVYFLLKSQKSGGGTTNYVNVGENTNPTMPRIYQPNKSVYDEVYQPPMIPFRNYNTPRLQYSQPFKLEYRQPLAIYEAKSEGNITARCNSPPPFIYEPPSPTYEEIQPEGHVVGINGAVLKNRPTLHYLTKDT